jgi:hypothetical protein
LNLLLIGIGPWSSKIKTAIDSSDSQIEVRITSAREVLSDDCHVIANLRDFDVIWISTKSENQLNILRQLKTFSGTIFLEKPYAASSAGLSNLAEFIAEHDLNIKLSQPWTFSQHWLFFKEEMLRCKINDFEITRGGPTGHDYLNPVLDWIPHDLNLIFSYFNGSINQIETKNIKWNIANDSVELVLIVNDSYRFHLVTGNIGSERIATWVSGEKIFDFNKPLNEQGASVEKSFLSKHSFVDMLQAKIPTSKLQIISQLQFQQVVISSLGL